MKNSIRDTPIHHEQYIRSNHVLLFKGSNDFQRYLQLPNIKGGIKLQKEDTILQYQERVDLSILAPSFHPRIYER
jgi:hypothetical protein